MWESRYYSFAGEVAQFFILCSFCPHPQTEHRNPAVISSTVAQLSRGSDKMPETISSKEERFTWVMAAEALDHAFFAPLLWAYGEAEHPLRKSMVG